MEDVQMQLSNWGWLGEKVGACLKNTKRVNLEKTGR